jgi:type II secretory pathway component GspD/PulD (secretin)
MNKKLVIVLTLIALVAALIAPASAQTSEPDRVIPSVEIDNGDVGEVLRTVFKNTEATFKLDPQVTGTVTISERNITLGNLLKAILKQVNAAYRIENGVYLIEKIGAVQVTGDKPLSVTLKNSTVADATRMLCMKTGASFRIEPGIQGRITLTAKDIALEELLNLMLGQVNAKYRKENGVYLIEKK